MPNDRRKIVTILAFGACCTLLAASPARAQFFERLFGMPSPMAQLSDQGVRPYYDDEAPRSRPRRRSRSYVSEDVRRALDDEPAVRQQTTDIMHDPTLRWGDAVMMKDGVHIFQGERSDEHTADEFVPLQKASVSRKQVVALADVGALGGASLHGDETQTNQPIPVNLPPERAAAREHRHASRHVASRHARAPEFSLRSYERSDPSEAEVVDRYGYNSSLRYGD